MKTIKILCAAGAALAIAGCAYSANQKLAAPLLGTVSNTYIIYNIALDKDMPENQLSNVVSRVRAAAAFEEGGRKQSRLILGRGSSVIAVDDQILVGRDIGNVSSNDVSASASVPISL